MVSALGAVKGSSMRIFVLTLGTLGDIEVLLTLSRALRRRGHDVLVGTSPFFCARVRDAGLPDAVVGDGTRDDLIGILRSLRDVADRRARTVEFAARWLKRQLTAGMGVVGRVAANADYVVNNLGVLLSRGGRVIPGAVVKYDPRESLDDFIGSGRREHDGHVLELVAMPKALLDPHGQCASEVAFTGFWFADGLAVGEASRPLMEFVAAGSPPVVLTMGSMATFDPRALLARASDAIRRAGRRGVVVSAWSGIPSGADESGTVLVTETVPYAWLFPRAACVIHHGGTGTVGETVRAGCPSIVLPQVACQELFARALDDAGLVAGVFDTATLDVGALAGAIMRAVSDERLTTSARYWQNVIARDEGVEGAVDRIEAHAAQVVRDEC